jgi:hypothetical protein
MTVVDTLQDLEHREPRPMTGKVKLPDRKWILHQNSEGTKIVGEAVYLSQYDYCAALFRELTIIYYSQEHLLTVFELQRLQRFPDDYD